MNFDYCHYCDGQGYTIEQVGYENDGTVITDNKICESCEGTGELK